MGLRTSLTANVRLLTLLAVIATAGGGCADRGRPVIGVAMGGMSDSLLIARQLRFNDSVGVRHRVELRLSPSGDFTGDNAALAWATELVQTPRIVGVVGHESSRSSLQAAPVYRHREIVQLVPTGTSRELATVSPWTFPLVASDKSQGTLLATHLRATRRKRVTVFVQDDEYGRGIEESLRNELEGSEITVLEDVTHTPKSDFALLVRSVMSHAPAPDALVLITQGPLASTIAELAWKRDPTLLILGTDAANTDAKTLRALAPAPDLLVLATYWVPDETNVQTQAFLEDFRASHLGGEPQWYHAALYDAVGLLDAAAASAGNDPSGVRDWLRSLGRSRPAYAGVLGRIDFTGEHPIPARLVCPSPGGWEVVK